MDAKPMAEVLPKPWTVDDFLAWEAGQPERYEFVDGVLRMMVGASAAHTVIKDNITAALRVQLRGTPCRAFSEGLKVVTRTAVLYPDVIVTCAPVAPADDRIHEPVAIFEVLSRTTAEYDRGTKGEVYRAIATLQHYVLVGQDRRRVELFSRAGDGWLLHVLEPPIATIELSSLNAKLSLDDVYVDSGA
jgi:Uma2 family endonuclease